MEKKIIQNHRHQMLNLYLFLSFGGWCGWHTYKTYLAGKLDYVEIAFVVQNLILIFLFLIRKEHKAFNTRKLDQIIAIIAFCSGAAFIGQPSTADGITADISKYIIFAANVLGGITLINLGTSFGVLIALREVKTKGLYNVVRHPMYFTDILLRIGFLVSHFTWFIVIAFVVSTGCYVYRAILEERFLGQDESYQGYMTKVRYRFIPYLF